MSEGLTGAVGCSPAPVSYDFYLDGYGGALSAAAFIVGKGLFPNSTARGAWAASRSAHSP